MDLETFGWLLTPDGQQLLERAAQVQLEAQAAGHEDPVHTAAAVRRIESDPDRAAAALTTVQLRARASTKFGVDAARLYFSPDALEQSTHGRVAEHRAARLALAQPASVLDLGCGIGGDLIAFARAGLTAAGVDQDPVRVAMAEANLAALGLPGAVQVADGTTLDLTGFAVVFADPARRSGRGRSFRVDDWTPPWSFVESLLGRDAVVKVAPGIPHDLLPEDVEAEWVSVDGEVKEATLWSGLLASTARRATVIGSGGLATLTEDDDPWQGEPRPVRELGRFLYEPDGAVIRSGLVTAVAAGVHGGLIDEHIAWVTSDESFQTPFARGYQVLEEVPFREKALRAALRERSIGTLAIKTRGVDVVPEQLRKRLALRGDNSATLVLTRVAGAGTALLVKQFTPAS